VPNQIPLRVIQVLLEPVQVEPDLDYTSTEEDSEVTAGQVAMTMQQTSSDVDVKRKNRTLRLRGFIGKHEALIQVDSGSA